MENIFSINSHKSSESVFILDTSHTKKKSAVAVAIVKRKQEFIIFAFNFPKRISKKRKRKFQYRRRTFKGVLGCWMDDDHDDDNKQQQKRRKFSN